jgi:hypothetical protein
MIEIPKFRYMDDVRRFLEGIDKELDDSGKVLIEQQKLLARRLLPGTPVSAVMVFNVTPTDRKDQLSLVRKMKTKVDPSLTKVVVPNMKKLESQYNMAEDLYEKLRAVEQVETQMSLAFPDRRGEQFEATMLQISKMKTKIADQLKLCLGFLSQVAEAHVPAQFTKYTQMIADLVNEHVIFKESHQFLYVSVDAKGNLLFTNYLMLQDVANDNGEIAPHLYISVQWKLGKEPSMTVDLNHEYEVPNKLIGGGDEVGSVGEAVKAISEMLELENFSSALGVVPLALQLNVDPTSLKPNIFSYRDMIGKIVVDERSMGFRLRKEVNNPALVTEVAAQIYKELKALMRTKDVRLTMKTEKVKGIYTLTFTFNKIAQGGEFSHYDMEFLRTKFDLDNAQLRKIMNVINKGKES